jgi:hypothetical protein
MRSDWSNFHQQCTNVPGWLWSVRLLRRCNIAFGTYVAWNSVVCLVALWNCECCQSVAHCRPMDVHHCEVFE